MITYENINWLVLDQPPHHRRNRTERIIEDPTYPRPSLKGGGRVAYGGKTEKDCHLRKSGVDAEGHTQWEVVSVWRGLDKRIPLRAKYTGEDLRRIRALNGVGRPRFEERNQ